MILLFIVIAYIIFLLVKREVERRMHYTENLFQDARYYLERSQYRLAIRRYSRLIAIQPRNPVYYLERSLAFLKSAQPELARIDLRKVQPHRLKHPEMHRLMGLLYLKLEAYPEAEAAARRALQHEPHHPDAHFTLGLAALHSGRTADAVDTFRSLADDYPERALYWNHLGLALYAEGKLEPALDAFGSGMAMADEESERSVIISNYTEVLIDLGRELEALGYSAKAIDADDTNATAYWQKGTLLMMLGEWNDAFFSMEKAMVLQFDTQWQAYIRMN